MAHETALQSFSAAAGADLSALQYTFVTLNSSGQVVAAAANSLAAGVLQNNPVSGEAANVAIGGETKIKLGATLAAGAIVEVGATGGKAAAAAGTGSYVMGILTLGGADNEIGSMVIRTAGPLA
jgi:hypothetical protein